MQGEHVPLSSGILLALFLATIVVLLFGMQLRMGEELLDDGAFFLRYAVNAANGEFWVWNQGEPPVWGASAPFYPILIALPIALGVPPVTALVVTGMALSVLSFAALVTLVARHFGVFAGISLLVFLFLDSNLMWMSVNGLESPLTVALLTAGVWALLARRGALLVGLVAGLLMVHKLDLVPVGGLLLLALWLRDVKLPVRGFVLAALIATLWYGFAWWYFGAPIPNSFLTKAVHQDHLPKTIDWTWFGHLVLWVGVHKWLVGLSLIAVALGGRSRWPLHLFLLGTVATHVIAYSIRYPFEPYNWYAVPSVLALCVTGAIGITLMGERLGAYLPTRPAVVRSLMSLTLIVIFGFSYPEERAQTRWMTMFTTHQEHDRAEAGRWVAAHAPSGFGVYTAWGNPAYFSDRYVYDGSFLNRPYEDGDLIATYRPEIVIWQAAPGASPSDPMPPWLSDVDYAPLRVFDRTHSAGMDYFFVVLARSDVLYQLPAPDLPRDLMAHVDDIALGDTFGVVQERGGDTLFVHPGRTTPTAFTLSPEVLRGDDGTCRPASLTARISDDVSQDAVARGGAIVRLSLTRNGTEVTSAIVDLATPLRVDLNCAETGDLRISVGPEGSPDSDWLLLSVE
jgi:hypothetical protein